MTHKVILQKHLYDISQGYSIKVPRGMASIYSKQSSGQFSFFFFFTCIVFLHLHAMQGRVTE